ncbi:MAG: RecX family transcriptional regulator, partial [Oscillospiraceae bacterium]|nr:RecX family transcriptional regulator [Oscillospiraceae bacterium]
LSRDIVDEALSEYDEKIHDILTELIMKKYYDSLEDRDKLRKMKNALVRQGYSFDEINTVIRELEVCDDE